VAEPLTVGPLTRTDFVRYAGASGDFNPVHHDELYAIRASNERPFAVGMLPAGYLGTLLEEWLGENQLRTFRVRFVLRVWPGDVLTCRARVASLTHDDAAVAVECDAWIENQHGERVIDGHASAVLP